MQTPETMDGDLGDLYALYGRLAHAATPEERRTLSEAIILHPMFQVRLRGACGVAMRRWAARSDLRGDVMQEATLMIVERLRDSTPVCDDLGLRCFGSWCWTLCYRACLKAWAKSRPLWCRSIQLVELETLAAMPDRSHAPPAWEALIVCFSEVSDDVVRGILVDWAFGVTATDTACRYCLSRDSVWRLRRRGLAHLRRLRPEQN